MKEVFKTIINQTIKPIMKGALFKKKALNFYKKENGLFYLINLQKSHGSTPNEITFYINCCIHSNMIETALGKNILEFPKEYQCHFCQRIENLAPHAPEKFQITSITNVDALNRQLKESLQVVLDLFQQIDNDQAFVELLSKYGTLKQGDIFRFCIRKEYVTVANNLVGLFKQNIDQERWEMFFAKEFLEILDEENSALEISNLSVV